MKKFDKNKDDKVEFVRESICIECIDFLISAVAVSPFSKENRFVFVEDFSFVKNKVVFLISIFI